MQKPEKLKVSSLLKLQVLDDAVELVEAYLQNECVCSCFKPFLNDQHSAKGPLTNKEQQVLQALLNKLPPIEVRELDKERYAHYDVESKMGPDGKWAITKQVVRINHDWLTSLQLLGEDKHILAVFLIAAKIIHEFGHYFTHEAFFKGELKADGKHPATPRGKMGEESGQLLTINE